MSIPHEGFENQVRKAREEVEKCIKYTAEAANYGLNIISDMILPLFGYTIRTNYIFSTYVNFQINISRTIRCALQRMLIRIYPQVRYEVPAFRIYSLVRYAYET